MTVEPAPLAEKPKDAAGSSDLMLRVVSALVLAPLAIFVAYLPEQYPVLGPWLFALFWLAAALAIWWEWNTLVSGAGHRLLFFLGGTALTLAAIIAEFGAARTRTPILIVILGALAVGVFARKERRVWGAGGLLYAGAVLTAPIILRRDPQLGFVAILFVFAVVWATDIVGYFVGRTFGGPKLAPSISPNKTWSGAIGGLLGAVVAGVALARLFGLADLIAIGVIAILLSVVSQIGDLFESRVKRRFGAKDAGKLIPGHGGVMDRLDGFVAAAAAAAIIGVGFAGLATAAQGLLLW